MSRKIRLSRRTEVSQGVTYTEENKYGHILGFLIHITDPIIGKSGGIGSPASRHGMRLAETCDVAGLDAAMSSWGDFAGGFVSC